MATERAPLGSFLFNRPDPKTRTLDARVAGHVEDLFAGPTSCWASR
jgi:hypothetical protein